LRKAFVNIVLGDDAARDVEIDDDPPAAERAPARGDINLADAFTRHSLGRLDGGAQGRFDIGTLVAADAAMLTDANDIGLDFAIKDWGELSDDAGDFRSAEVDRSDKAAIARRSQLFHHRLFRRFARFTVRLAAGDVRAFRAMFNWPQV
jgi:hypothetical protein